MSFIAYRGRFLTSTNIFPIYSPIMPIQINCIEERKQIENKFVKEYVSSTRIDKNLTAKNEKLIHTYKNHKDSIIEAQPEIEL